MENEYTERSGSIEVKDLPRFITLDSFVEMGLEEIPPYKGKGESSTNIKYDISKSQYVEDCGITIPEEWKEDRALIHTTFVLLIGIGGFRRAVKDNVPQELAYSYILQKWIQKRIDSEGDRTIGNLESNKVLSEYVADQGGSANPQLRVRPDELLMVYNHIHDTYFNLDSVS